MSRWHIMASVLPMVARPPPARDGPFHVFRGTQLEEMTEGWKDLVGRGGFGEVFTGRLPVEYGEGKVAVKRSRQQNNGNKLRADSE